MLFLLFKHEPSCIIRMRKTRQMLQPGSADNYKDLNDGFFLLGSEMKYLAYFDR